LFPLFCTDVTISNRSSILQIGQGSFGTVYKIDNQYIYITIMYRNPKVYNGELKGLFLNYLLTLYYNDKPDYSRYLCKLYEFGFIGMQLKKILYCIQENGGKDLYEYLQKNYNNSSWKNRDAISKMKYFLEILLQCSESLKLLHDIGYVHLDIKPENFLIKENSDGTFQIKIIDFGFTQPIDHDLNNLIGTPPYINLLYHQNIKNKRSTKALYTYDIFALGCMFIEFITNYIFNENFYAVLPFIYEKNYINPESYNIIIKKRCAYTDESIEEDLTNYLFTELSTKLSTKYNTQIMENIKMLIRKMVYPTQRFNNIKQLIDYIKYIKDVLNNLI